MFKRSHLIHSSNPFIKSDKKTVAEDSGNEQKTELQLFLTDVRKGMV